LDISIFISIDSQNNYMINFVCILRIYFKNSNLYSKHKLQKQSKFKKLNDINTLYFESL